MGFQFISFLPPSPSVGLAEKPHDFLREQEDLAPHHVHV